MKEYFELSINFNKKNYDRICNILYANGIRNLLEENNIIKIYFDVKGYKRILRVKKELHLLPSLSKKSLQLTVHKSHNWYNEWKNSIEPVNIENKIIVYPSWRKKEVNRNKDKILIEIDPKMSFGTGHSETTQMMLKMMCRVIDEEDKTMLDYGCGTGILSIAGIKLGLKSVTAIDIDKDSIDNAQDYLSLNRVGKKIKLYKADIDNIKENEFDIIAANIDLKVIKNKLHSIYHKTKFGGKNLISGILKREQPIIVNALNKNKFKVNNIISQAEWICLYTIKE
jgi:ribosomal protein L11 methyltransferase